MTIENRAAVVRARRMEEAEAVRARKRTEAAGIPVHPSLGPWEPCLCDSDHCHLVHPTRMGAFYQGTGFTPDEARSIVEAFRCAEAG